MPLDDAAAESVIIGIFDLNRRSTTRWWICTRFGSIYSTRKTMAKRKRKITDEDVRRSLGDEILAERIAHYERKRAEKQHSSN